MKSTFLAVITLFISVSAFAKDDDLKSGQIPYSNFIQSACTSDPCMVEWPAVPEGYVLHIEHINLKYLQDVSAVIRPQEIALYTSRMPPADNGSNIVLQWIRWEEQESFPRTDCGSSAESCNGNRIDADILAFVLPGLHAQLSTVLIAGPNGAGTIFGTISGWLIPTEIVIEPDPV